jgi:hypothetical protein
MTTTAALPVTSDALTVSNTLEVINKTLDARQNTFLNLPGSGADSPRGSVVLTATSPAVISVVTEAFGQFVKMADALTLQTGIQIVAVYNDGPFPLRLLDYDETLLGFVQPGDYALCSLVDNTSAAGVWRCLGSTRVGYAAALQTTAFTSLATSQTGSEIDLDGDIGIVYGVNTSTHPVAVAYRKSTGEFGDPLVLRTANCTFRSVIRHTDTQFLAVTLTTAGAMQACTFAVNPTTLALTPGTAANVNLADTYVSSAIGDALQAIPSLPNSFVMGYSRTGSVRALRAISISGTTSTIGAETTLTGDAANPIFVTTANRVIAVSAGGGQLHVQPYTVSGSTLTLGTGVSVTAVVTSLDRLVTMGTRWCAIYTTTGITLASLITLTGTTITLSTVTLFSSSTFATCAVVNGFRLFAMSNATSGTPINILTDDNGTAVLGTPIASMQPASGSARNVIRVYDDTAEVLVQEMQGGTNAFFHTYTCTSTSPVASRVISTLPGSTTATVGAQAANLDSGLNLLTGTVQTNLLSADRQTDIAFYGLGVANFEPRTTTVATGFVRGANNRTRWATPTSANMILKLEIV